MNSMIIRIGRFFLAIAFLGLGIEHFVFGDFITGRAPAWPASFPGGMVWAYLSGLGIIAMSMSIISGRKARFAAILSGAVIFVWALLRYIPILAADSFLSASWTGAGKALVFTGGLLAAAATFPKFESNRGSTVLELVKTDREYILIGRFSLGVFMIICGIQHFMFTQFVASLIPEWFPGDPMFWTYFAAIALLAGGTGLFLHRTARVAALLSGLMIFSWFWIVHIPRTFASVSDGIAVFEALGVSGIGFILAGYTGKKSVTGMQ
jgi:uncharacterized membrane protein